MNIPRLSTIEITPLSDEEFVHADGSSFDVVGYSLMKYGDSHTAWQYGQEVAEAAIEQTSGQLSQPDVLITVPACVYSPKPAFAIARAMAAGVNNWRTQQGLQPAKMLRMYSEAMGDPNYAQANLEDRQKDRFNKVKQRHIPPSLVKDAAIFAVDDCVITGSTEQSQYEILAPYEPSEFISAPAIVVDPEKAKLFPGIEHVMNTAANPSLESVSKLIEQGTFMLNSRVLKLIVGHENKEELETFLGNCSWQLISEMYEACINSTLEFVEEYSDSVALLQRTLNSK